MHEKNFRIKIMCSRICAAAVLLCVVVVLCAVTGVDSVDVTMPTCSAAVPSAAQWPVSRLQELQLQTTAADTRSVTSTLPRGEHAHAH